MYEIIENANIAWTGKKVLVEWESILKNCYKSEWMNSSVVDMVTSLSHSCSAQKQKKNRKMWISPKIKSVITIFIICPLSLSRSHTPTTSHFCLRPLNDNFFCFFNNYYYSSFRLSLFLSLSLSLSLRHFNKQVQLENKYFWSLTATGLWKRQKRPPWVSGTNLRSWRSRSSIRGAGTEWGPGSPASWAPPPR